MKKGWAVVFVAGIIVFGLSSGLVFHLTTAPPSYRTTTLLLPRENQEGNVAWDQVRVVVWKQLQKLPWKVQLQIRPHLQGWPFVTVPLVPDGQATVLPYRGKLRVVSICFIRFGCVYRDRNLEMQMASTR